MRRTPGTPRRNIPLRIVVVVATAAVAAAGTIAAALASSPMLAVFGPRWAYVELRSPSNPGRALAAATGPDRAWPVKVEIGSLLPAPERARLTFKRGQTNSMD